jgi:hypothetical protein
MGNFLILHCFTSNYSHRWAPYVADPLSGALPHQPLLLRLTSALVRAMECDQLAFMHVHAMGCAGI